MCIPQRCQKRSCQTNVCVCVQPYGTSLPVSRSQSCVTEPYFCDRERERDGKEEEPVTQNAVGPVDSSSWQTQCQLPLLQLRLPQRSLATSRDSGHFFFFFFLFSRSYIIV